MARSRSSKIPIAPLYYHYTILQHKSQILGGNCKPACGSACKPFYLLVAYLLGVAGLMKAHQQV